MRMSGKCREFSGRMSQRIANFRMKLRIDKSRIPKLGENIFRAAVDIRTEQCYEMEIRGEKIDEYQQKCCFMT